ncbi:MAG: DUF456 domain-containing protein [candidate division WOR-3 bacterium]|nr:MAG: DUF456 domain-containing protein [candidate division WOR-3 bacterium]
MTFLQILVFIVALIIMIIGLAGVILPILPGIPLIFAAAFLYGIVTGFEKITLHLILIFAGLTVFGLIVDYIANYFSVRKMGGGRAGAIGAVIGLFIGIFFVGLIGIILLPFVFAVVFELIAGKREGKALKAGIGVFFGLLFGWVLRFTIGCVMIGIFIWRVLFW